jgi:hypothetical protein
MSMISQIDDKQAISQQPRLTSANAVDIRGSCLEIVLPRLLHSVQLDAGLSPEAAAAVRDAVLPSIPDLREVMRMAGERADDLYWNSIARLGDGPGTTTEPGYDNCDSGLEDGWFRYVRPHADHRANWLFELGVIDDSPGVIALVQEYPHLWSEFNFLLQRHQRGDWGEIPEEDALANQNGLWREFDHSITSQEAARHRDAVYSFYVCEGYRIWVITDPRREATRVCLADEL